MGIKADEYRTFKTLSQFVIKEINALTDYHVEVEHKHIGRKVAELKFCITRVKQLPVQESLFPDIENLSPLNSSKYDLSGSSRLTLLTVSGN